MTVAPFFTASWTSVAVSAACPAGAVAAAAVRPAPVVTLSSPVSCETLAGVGSAPFGSCCAADELAATPAGSLQASFWASCALLLFGASPDPLASLVTAAGSLITELDARL